MCTNGSATNIYKTTDGGDTWTTSATIPFLPWKSSIDFYQYTIGIATGKNVFYYSTDGATWNQGVTPTNWPQNVVYSRTQSLGT